MKGGDRVESRVQGGEVTINKQWSECSALKAHVVQYTPEQLLSCLSASTRAMSNIHPLRPWLDFFFLYLL